MECQSHRTTTIASGGIPLRMASTFGKLYTAFWKVWKEISGKLND